MGKLPLKSLNISNLLNSLEESYLYYHRDLEAKSHPEEYALYKKDFISTDAWETALNAHNINLVFRSDWIEGWNNGKPFVDVLLLHEIGEWFSINGARNRLFLLDENKENNNKLIEKFCGITLLTATPYKEELLDLLQKEME